MEFKINIYNYIKYIPSIPKCKKITKINKNKAIKISIDTKIKLLCSYLLIIQLNLGNLVSISYLLIK